MAFDRNRSRKRRKVCVFCVDKIQTIDYKDTNKLRRYISERGKICLLYTSCSMCPATPPGRWRCWTGAAGCSSPETR